MHASGSPVSAACDRHADRVGVSVRRAGRTLGTESFSQEGEAIWWAFLRLTDPGYLGDDQGMFKRALSSVLTVLGYVLFMGSLIAIMTQWLNAKLRALESGLTPIAQNGHILILGWTNRTAAVVRELIRSEGRLKRFLKRLGNKRSLKIVIMVEDVTPELVLELEEEVGPGDWNPNRVIFRSGTPLRIEHLRRVDFANAAAIILPGADFAYGGADASDTRIVKTLLNIANHGKSEPGEPLQLLTTEVFDRRKVSVAEATYSGPLEVLASNAFVAQLMAQNLRHPSLSQVYSELLSHNEGSEVYVRESNQFAGRPIRELRCLFPQTVILGLCRPDGKRFRPMLNPAGDTVLESGDRIVFLADSYEDCEEDNPVVDAAPDASRTNRGKEAMSDHNVLIVGWNHKIPTLLEALDHRSSEHFRVTILSSLSREAREQDIQRDGITLSRIEMVYHQADTTVQTAYDKVDPAEYDSILFAASDRFQSGEESDATTILRYLVMMEVVGGRPRPKILVELMDPENVSLLPEGVESIVSPVLLSHMLAQVALRRELHTVFDHLFGPEEADISLSPASRYGVAGKELTFGALQDLIFTGDETVMGLRRDGMILIDPDRSQTVQIRDTDELILLTNF